MFCFKKIAARGKKTGDRGQGAGGRKRLLWLILFFLITEHWSLNTVVNAHESRPFLTDKIQFNYAMFLYKQGHYIVSAKEFGRVIEYFPGTPIIPQAQYMIGNAYLNASMYKEAKDQFEQFVKNFPDSEFMIDASLKLDTAKAKLKDIPADTKQGEIKVIAAPKLPIVKVQPNPLTAQSINPVLPLRAVQIALFEAGDYDGVDDELNKLKKAGIDTIILRVFHNRDDRFYPFIIKPKTKAGVYFKTNHSPVVADILSPILNMAHKKGLKVFAWMTTRYADYGLEDKKEFACKAYDFNTKDIVRCKGLDLFNEDAVDHLERVFNDLANYPIDGILFQDDLVLKHNEGFGQYSEVLFEKENNKKLVPEELYNGISENDKGGYYVAQYTPTFWRWTLWKNKKLLQVATRIRAIVQKKNPDVKFAINLMYESVSNPPYALAWLSQSLSEAVKQEFDYYAIMAYHQQMQEELKKEPYEIFDIIKNMTIDAVQIVGNPQKVLIKLQTIDWNTSQPLPNYDVIRLLKDIKKINKVSIAVTPYRQDFPFEEL